MPPTTRAKSPRAPAPEARKSPARKSPARKPPASSAPSAAPPDWTDPKATAAAARALWENAIVERAERAAAAAAAAAAASSAPANAPARKSPAPARNRSPARNKSPARKRSDPRDASPDGPPRDLPSLAKFPRPVAGAAGGWAAIPMEKGVYRGVSASTVLSAGPELHQSDVSGAHTSALSAELDPREQMAVFVSHSWRSLPVAKHLALCLMLNGEFALKILYLAGALLTALGLVLRSRGVHLPAYGTPVAGGTIHTTLLVGVCGGACGLLAFFFGHLLPPRGLGRSMLFLDKCCVPQADAAKKRRAIGALGGFLDRSRGMAVLWDREYFSRLWCVYELAARVHRVGMSFGRPIDFHCLHEAAFATLGLIVTTIYGPLACALVSLNATHRVIEPAALRTLAGQALLWTICAAPQIWLPQYVCCHSSVSAYAAAKQQIERFSVRKAAVSEKADRPMIEASIKEWFGSIDAFEEKVRTELWGRLRMRVCETRCPPYMTLLLLNAPLFLHLAGDGLLGAKGPEEAHRVLSLALFQHLIANPLGIYAFGSLAELTSRLPSPIALCCRALGVPLVGLWWPLSLALFVNGSHGQLALAWCLGIFLVFRIWFRPYYMPRSVPIDLQRCAAAFAARHERGLAEKAAAAGAAGKKVK